MVPAESPSPQPSPAGRGRRVPLTPTLSRGEGEELKSAFSGAGGGATELRPLLRLGLRG